jgi:hypothetical protein
MPIKLSNVNFFIPKDSSSSISWPWRIRGILRCHVRVAARSLFRVRVPATTHGDDFVLAFTPGTLKERPEHCDHDAHRQYRDKDDLPRTSRRRGKVDMRIYTASKNQAQTVGMVIKNQNMPYFFEGSIWCRQTARLLDGKNPLCTDAGRSAHGEGPRQIRLMIGYGSNEWHRERHLSMVKAFPFHDFMLRQTIESLPWRMCRIF